MLRNTLKIAWIVAGAMMLLFFCDILLWTVGLNNLEPTAALVRGGIWCVPFCLSSYALYRLTPEEKE